MAFSGTFPQLTTTGAQMELKNVGLIAAMPGEIKPLLKIAGKYSKTKLGEFSFFSFCVAGKKCRLIESGIGMNRASNAAQALISECNPEVVISFGFGGAVLPGMSPGDLAVARRTFLFHGMLQDPGETFDLFFPPGLLETLEKTGNKVGYAVRQCDFITSDKILNKKELTGLLPKYMINPVLDMETWAIAREAMRERVPLLAIRAISDAADEELEFSLDRFTDHEMNIRISRILRTIAMKPSILPQLIRLAYNSRIAGNNLGVAVQELLQMESMQSLI